MTEIGKKRKATIIRKRKAARKEQNIPYKGKNFKFVSWGGLEDLKLWSREAELEIGRR